MLNLLIRGGVCMIPLALCSIAALAVAIERAIVIRRMRRQTDAFAAEFLEALDEGGTTRALRLAVKDDRTLAKILAPALRGDPAFDAELPRRILGRRLGALPVIVQVAPLLGFLGTVTGMIAAFQRMQELAAAGRQAGPGDLAGGIWEALITTAAGLIIAIPAYLAHSALTGAVNRTIDRLESARAECLRAFKQKSHERKTALPQAAGAGLRGA